MNKSRLRHSDLPKKHHFVLNPYPHMRVSKCPFCDGRTGQRKLPLVIHIDPRQLMVLNYTSRYCKACDLLIAHKHEVEHLLTEQMKVTNPSIIGNDYLIMGAIDRKLWKDNMKNPKPPMEILNHLVSFDAVYEELRCTQVGWFPEGIEPGIEEPPPSKEWIKK